MTADATFHPTGDEPAAPLKTTAKTPGPPKVFDPTSLKGGKQPGGKMLRGTKTMLPGKSRGRG